MNWIEQFPELAKLEHTTVNLLLERGAIMHVPADTVIFGPGNQPDNLILLLEGSVRVQQLSGSGREIVLYRLHAGESCVNRSLPACFKRLFSAGDHRDGRHSGSAAEGCF